MLEISGNICGFIMFIFWGLNFNILLFYIFIMGCDIFFDVFYLKKNWMIMCYMLGFFLIVFLKDKFFF